MSEPLHDLSDCVLDCAVPIVIRRATTAPMKYGRSQAPTLEDIPIQATVTPVTGDAKQFSTDGQWSEGAITIYSVDKLLSIHASPVGVADVVSYQGADYCVQKVKDWHALGGFYESVAERVER